MKKPRTIADVNRDQGREMEEALGPIEEKEAGCTCHQLPDTDMDGSAFGGRCRWCQEQQRKSNDVCEFLQKRLDFFKSELLKDNELQYDAEFEHLRSAYRLVIDDIQGD